MYRYEENNGMFIGSNVADVNGMEPYSDYLLSEYLSDLLEYESRKVVAVDADKYTFSDGATEILQERCEEIDPEVLAEIFSQYS